MAGTNEPKKSSLCRKCLFDDNELNRYIELATLRHNFRELALVYENGGHLGRFTNICDTRGYCSMRLIVRVY